MANLNPHICLARSTITNSLNSGTLAKDAHRGYFGRYIAGSHAPANLQRATPPASFSSLRLEPGGSYFMNKIKWLAPSLLALCVASSGALKAHSLEAQPVPNASLAQDHDHDQDRWDEPPSDYRDAQRRGFHEDVEAARH